VKRKSACFCVGTKELVTASESFMVGVEVVKSVTDGNRDVGVGGGKSTVLFKTLMGSTYQVCR